MPTNEEPTEVTEELTPGSALEPAEALSAALHTESPALVATQVVPPMSTTPVVTQTTAVTGPGFIVRAIWFLLIGWWVTGFAIAFAWMCSITIILIPLAYMIVNAIPVLLTLRPRAITTRVHHNADGTIHVTTARATQNPFWVRAVYFVLVGWWATGIVMTAAYTMCLTIILLPIGLLLFNRLPAIMTLQRN